MGEISLWLREVTEVNQPAWEATPATDATLTFSRTISVDEVQSMLWRQI